MTDVQPQLALLLWPHWSAADRARSKEIELAHWDQVINILLPLRQAYDYFLATLVSPDVGAELRDDIALLIGVADKRQDLAVRELLELRERSAGRAVAI